MLTELNSVSKYIIVKIYSAMEIGYCDFWHIAH